MPSTCVVKVSSLWVPHSSCVKCGSLRFLLLNTRHGKHWEHLCSELFSRTVELIEKGFGGSLAVLFTSRNCLRATFVHHHNVEINKKNHPVFSDSVYVCIYTHTSAIIPTDGVSEKSHKASRCQNWTSATSVSAWNVLKVGLWESCTIDVALTAKQVG